MSRLDVRRILSASSSDDSLIRDVSIALDKALATQYGEMTLCSCRPHTLPCLNKAAVWLHARRRVD